MAVILEPNTSGVWFPKGSCLPKWQTSQHFASKGSQWHGGEWWDHPSCTSAAIAAGEKEGWFLIILIYSFSFGKKMENVVYQTLESNSSAKAFLASPYAVWPWLEGFSFDGTLPFFLVSAFLEALGLFFLATGFESFLIPFEPLDASSAAGTYNVWIEGSYTWIVTSKRSADKCARKEDGKDSNSYR